MSTFKDKPLKKCHTDKRRMIDDIHSSLIKDFDMNDRHKYYLDNGLFLDNYYKESTPPTITQDKSGILTYFTGNDNREHDVVDKTKKELINNYMCNIDDSFIEEHMNDILDKCRICQSKMTIINEISELLCPECGFTENIMITTEKSSFNDPPREVSYFTYKRINHFNEWLAQFQAKETTELPDDIYKDVYNELKKNINFDMKYLNYHKVREILKKLKYNKYYENIPHIINVINGVKAPKLSSETEEILRSLFKDIQVPFMNNCPPNRRNFLSYSYVLHKFCELLELDYLLEFFPLLKSREKLQQQDKIWKDICKDLKWQYIPSV